ncbi:hypothetical protein RN001_002546 [Aquatica leii]|uniref:Uncharacterized protein n=1 Tax=Aquatica leii TaxID=1421715 RepID=A0AAN7SSV1_9COLE|nr:hypothetical protein RN001_002546 [Aquatica leii]
MKIKTRLDLLCKTRSKQINYKGKRDVVFSVGEKVWCRDYRKPNQKQWTQCVIDEVLGKRVYMCKVINENIIWKRHLDQILRSVQESTASEKKNDRSSDGKSSAEVQHSPLDERKKCYNTNNARQRDHPRKQIKPPARLNL